jgi:predicted CoA-binding protein
MERLDLPDKRSASCCNLQFEEKGPVVNAKGILKSAETVLVIDWPSKEVPELLARAGLNVVVRGGSGPEDYSIYEITGEVHHGTVTERHTGRSPERADLIYSYRPLSELPGIIAAAKELGAKTIWYQSGGTATGGKDPKGCWVAKEELTLARNLVEAAGLHFITKPYVGHAVQKIRVAG